MATLPITYLTGVGLVKKSNGKIYVVSDPVAVGQYKVSGSDGIVVDDDGYLKVNVADGGSISIDDNGYLSVDFSQLPSSDLTSITQTIIEEGGGLAVDEDGRIYVDFSTMPTDKFEELLKSIRVPIWLEKNTNFYVDGTNGDDNNDGLTTSSAFKTIQAAIDYVTENYNLAAYNATIAIAPGTYNESLSIGAYNTNGGCIYIRSVNGNYAYDVFIESENADLISASNCEVRLCGLTLTLTKTEAVGSYYSAIKATNYASVYLFACHLKVIHTSGSGALNIMLASDYAVINVQYPTAGNYFKLEAEQSSTSRSTCAMRIINNGSIYLRGVNTTSYDADTLTVYIKGTFTYIVTAYRGGSLNCDGTYYWKWTIDTDDLETVSTDVYSCSSYAVSLDTGAYIVSGKQGQEWIPIVNTNGVYIEATTYCYYN